MKGHIHTGAGAAGLSRRTFLMGIGAGLASVVTANALAAGVAFAEESAKSSTPSILIDLTRCIGCNSCALACKRQNGLPDPDVVPHALDSNTFTYVAVNQVPSASGATKTRYAKRQCMHCLSPACVAACPAAAMYQSPEGPVIYRPNRCLGCRYCQVACPFGVTSFDWKNGLTPKISKCWFCHDRLLKGEKPACVAACPTGALRFGLRREMLAQAHAQIASNPDRYIDHIFGEHEMGGTSMLYLSDIPFDQLGFPVNLPSHAPSEETEKVMGALPTVILGVGALMTGTAVITHRTAARQAEQEQSSTEESHTPEGQGKGL